MFNLIRHDTEQQFERAIGAHANEIFGKGVISDCKHRIGVKDGKARRFAKTAFAAEWNDILQERKVGNLTTPANPLPGY